MFAGEYGGWDAPSAGAVNGCIREIGQGDERSWGVDFEHDLGMVDKRARHGGI